MRRCLALPRGDRAPSQKAGTRRQLRGDRPRDLAARMAVGVGGRAGWRARRRVGARARAAAPRANVHEERHERPRVAARHLTSPGSSRRCGGSRARRRWRSASPRARSARTCSAPGPPRAALRPRRRLGRDGSVARAGAAADPFDQGVGTGVGRPVHVPDQPVRGLVALPGDRSGEPDVATVGLGDGPAAHPGVLADQHRRIGDQAQGRAARHVFEVERER